MMIFNFTQMKNAIWACCRIKYKRVVQSLCIDINWASIISLVSYTRTGLEHMPSSGLHVCMVCAHLASEKIQQQQLFYGPLSGTTWVSWYQKKHSSTHIYPDHQPSFICLLHLLQSTASSLSNLRAWQSFSTTPLQVLFGLPLGLEPSSRICPEIHRLTCGRLGVTLAG